MAEPSAGSISEKELVFVVVFVVAFSVMLVRPAGTALLVLLLYSSRWFLRVFAVRGLRPVSPNVEASFPLQNGH